MERIMKSGRMRLGDLLIVQKLITKEQLEEALNIQRQRFEPLGQILIQMGVLSEERLIQVCAMQKGVAAWFLQRDPPSAEALALVPGVVCRSHSLIPVQIKGDKLLVAMCNPDDVDAIDIVRNISRRRVEPVLTSQEQLIKALDDAFGNKQSTEAMSRFISDAMGEFGVDKDKSPGRNEEAVTEAAMRPVVGLVNQMLTEAIRMRASDIHIEPRKDRVEIRYRVDGQLQKVHEIPSKLKAALIARIKIISQLDIVEYRVPQDGRTAFEVDGRIIDLRVSVLPNYHGQRIVMRILDKGVALRKLGELGFATHNLDLFQDIISKPYGLVLVTGPTGSGKTTSLYAALNQLKQVTNNIMTCEDPVEYDIDGINQSHVHEKVGLTFAAQLRAILRQDPDIVLVGEIRDRETAETAIRAALTGHLVLSTLHCNDAPSAIPRLCDMGVEPFMLSTALVGVTAQRLVRQLCSHCRQLYTPSPEERALLGIFADDVTTQVWRPVGCSGCNNTGYKGRTGVHEVFPTPHEVQRAIAAREPLENIREISERYGYRPMQFDAAQRVLMGQTSLSEARRMIAFEKIAPASPQTRLPELRVA
jgi:type IV pilus assembly protein PilB